MNFLNLGCGDRFHHKWININFTSNNPAVIAHNLTQGIPYPDESFDVVYHSHLLEHFPRNEAPSFLKECYRVLRPNGILRVVVPDLEQIILNYTFFLKDTINGSQEATDNYNWILLELFDQMVRDKSGGEMAKYLNKTDIPNKDFVIQRIGSEAIKLINSSNKTPPDKGPDSWYKNTFRTVYRFLRNSKFRRDTIFQAILGSTDYKALQIGRFRNSGEIHQWMYDRFSLDLLLKESGFSNVQQCSATESRVPNWEAFNLDTEEDGKVYKPDSLYMEAIKATI